MNTAASPSGDGWIEKGAKDFSGSPFVRIGSDWMLVASGDARSWNALTASWGGLGVLWGLDVAFIFVRPTRHTFGFLERNERFTLSFFDNSYRGALNFFGAHSGRDVDKAAGAKLSPIHFGDDAISFAEARDVLVCRKLYAQDIDPKLFARKNLEEHYPKKDYHRLYVGEIERLLVKAR